MCLIRVTMVLHFPPFNLPADASFTCDNVLEALSSVTAGDIGKILSIPFTKRMDLRRSCQESGVAYRESLVSYFVETSPYASWEWLGGRLLYWEMGPALQRVKEYIKAERRGTIG